MTGTVYNLEVNPQLPERLERLEELSNNLWYSWDRPTQGLFASLSHPLWKATNHNPKAFLKRADQKRLEAIAEDPVFLLRHLSRDAEYGARAWSTLCRR